MKIYFRISLALTIIFCFTLTSFTFGQEWSSEQKEVWSSVEDYWALSSKGDLDGFLSYFHLANLKSCYGNRIKIHLNLL